MKKATLKQKIELVKKLDCSYMRDYDGLVELVEDVVRSGELTEITYNDDGKNYLWYSDIYSEGKFRENDIIYCVDDGRFIEEEEFESLSFFEPFYGEEEE